jgi:hypothetical protein
MGMLYFDLGKFEEAEAVKLEKQADAIQIKHSQEKA